MEDGAPKHYNGLDRIDTKVCMHVCMHVCIFFKWHHVAILMSVCMYVCISRQQFCQII
jgi:hypothetical protein